MSGKIGLAVTITVALAMMGFGFLAADAMAQEAEPYVEESREWCNERGGELFNARVIGEHGGLHCEFENGTMVHMSEVLELNSDV